MNKYNEEYFSEIVKISINFKDVCRKLQIGTTYGNRQTVKKYIIKYNLNIDHFYTPPSSVKNFIKREFKDILIKNSTYNHNHNLKNRLYEASLKERYCELCGQSEEWMGKKMSLILDHINGINNDNRLENLRIVCPNCNATLDTHCGKNIKNKKKYYCFCGNEMSKYGKKCLKCSKHKQRKITNRPDLIVLVNKIKELGYSKTGLEYGVSDNTIRKWLKYYNINPKEIKRKKSK